MQTDILTQTMEIKRHNTGHSNTESSLFIWYRYHFQ